ncbi:thiol reductant ABC exporter subunit CydC [Cellulomonas soli]|uniref:Thiol reductant ABC exporter subunit CydC n=1 Tax=Cellulomonas soli TaxID=931535 RepID=A0A512PDN3_9CELL|nr:thiol reductant ABC exporter subunit CydC [Cellulomonas soli]NYI60038.1 ATP-binding cassette subfamily C protein CydC [Cellulomonas soli]GEP69308.1 thiol reductant ABC exporter subunit CydC [Cellulomonas soli]
MTTAPSAGVAPADPGANPQCSQARHGNLRRAVRLLDIDPRRTALAVLLGTLALGCAVALAAVSAWLIARASQMPPVLALSVATVAVRAFGIGRGVLRYTERLVSHDLALRGMATLRTTVYERLAAGTTGALVTLRRGDLLTRVGADVDAVGDVVVRGLLPAAVATTLGTGTVAAMAAFWPPAAAALALALLAAGLLAPSLAARAARTTEAQAASARSDMTATALGLLDDAGPLTVSGRVARELDSLRAADAGIARATDAGARAAAFAAAVGPLATGLAVLAALVTGVPAVRSGQLAPVELAVIVLTPLAAFEATSLLPAAAVQVQRSRAAAARVLALLDDAGPFDTTTGSAQPAQPGTSLASAPAAPVDGPRLVASGLVCGWPGRAPVLDGLDLDVRPGRSVAVVGASGAGKTTTLLTLAGLLPRVGGRLTLDGTDVAEPGSDDLARGVVVTTEDAHVFGTTVLENLRVARGDVSVEEARQVLTTVGLGPWLELLPDGLDTLLGPDARTVSGGERRRLLLARALLAPARLLLVDEPAEHLDPQAADALVRVLLADTRAEGRGVVVVTHRLSALDAADEVVLLEGGRVTARGTHAHLLATVEDYREAHDREQTTARTGA